MDFADMSARQLAATLARTDINSAWLTRVDLVMRDWKQRYPQLAEPYRLFVNARYEWHSKPEASEAREALQRALSELAVALTRLGSVRLPRCKAKLYHSNQAPCNTLLDANGLCPGRNAHF